MNYYNNPFMPQNYQSPYQQPQPQSIQQNNGINWVQGIEGAKAFQLNPNSNIILMDSELENTFYIKSSDNVGMCKLRVFKYTEVNPEEPKMNIDLSKYVTYEELERILGGRNEQSIQRNGQSNNQKQSTKPNNNGQHQQNQKHDGPSEFQQ